MDIHSIGGDIVDVSPATADAAVLWLRSGFNMRFMTWNFRILQEYPRLVPLQQPVSVERPWLAEADTLWEIRPPDRRLRYLYVFANPDDAHGYPTLDQVDEAVGRCLDRLSSLGVRSVAMIHIPFAPEGRLHRRADSEASAAAMLKALKRWGNSHLESIETILLVDRTNDFGNLVGKEQQK